MASGRHRRRVCTRIAYMPQGLGRNLYATLTVAENIDFFARLFGHARAERIRRIADTIGADQSEDAASRQIEVDGIERGDGTVTQADAVQSSDETGLLWAFRHGGSFTARLAGQSSLGSVRT